MVAPREHEHEYDVDHHGDSFYIRTNDRGRNFRLVRRRSPTRAGRAGARSSLTGRR